MALNINKIIVAGRLGTNPEFKTFENDSYVCELVESIFCEYDVGHLN